MRSRALGILLAAGLIAGLLCGCGEKRDGVSPIVDAEVDLKETEKLVIYLPDAGYSFTAPLKLTEEFKDFYSDVELRLEYVPAESYGSRVTTEIMAGGGPDIIFPSWLRDSDLYKMMDSGAFLNLNRVVPLDESFHAEDYIPGILEAAQYRGGQYLMPLSFYCPYLVSSEEALAEAGCKASDFENLFTLLDASIRITKERRARDPDYRGFMNDYPLAEDADYRLDRLFYSDIQLVDYENKIPLPDEDALRAWLVKAKEYLECQDFTLPQASLEEFHKGAAFGGVLAGNWSLNYEGYSTPYYLPRLIFGVKGAGQTPYFAGTPGKEGGKFSVFSEFLAINANSKNQKNAWNFIKIALAFTNQSSLSSIDFLRGYPVLKAAYTDRQSVTQSFIKDLWKTESDYWGNILGPMEPDEWNGFLAEITDPGKLRLPESGPVKALFEEELMPYFEEDADLDQCLRRLKNQLQLYVSE